MVLVNMNDKLYKKISKFVDKNPIDYPTIKHFVGIAVKEKLKKEKK